MPSDYKIIDNLFLIDPKEKIIICVDSTTDEEYQSFYEKIAKDNKIVKAAFYTPLKNE